MSVSTRNNSRSRNPRKETIVPTKSITEEEGHLDTLNKQSVDNSNAKNEDNTLLLTTDNRQGGGNSQSNNMLTPYELDILPQALKDAMKGRNQEEAEGLVEGDEVFN